MTTTPTTASDLDEATRAYHPAVPLAAAGSSAVVDAPRVVADPVLDAPGPDTSMAAAGAVTHAPAGTIALGPLADHERPWSAWRVRLTFLGAFLLLLVPVYLVLSMFWRNSQEVHGPAGETVAILSYIWILLAIPIFLNVIGALTFKKAGPEVVDPTPSRTWCASES